MLCRMCPKRTPGVLLFAVVLALALPVQNSAAQAPAPVPCTHPGAAQTARLLATEVACMINEVRGWAFMRRLRKNSRLQRTAGRYARFMVRHRVWSHRADGTAADRAARSGYQRGSSHWVVGEVLARTMTWNPIAVLQALFRSAEHRRVLLRPGFREIGVGVVHGRPDLGMGRGYTVVIDVGRR